MYLAATKPTGFHLAADALLALFQTPPGTQEEKEMHARLQEVGSLLLAEFLARVRAATTRSE
jgi:hypothetical protein